MPHQPFIAIKKNRKEKKNRSTNVDKTRINVKRQERYSRMVSKEGGGGWNWNYITMWGGVVYYDYFFFFVNTGGLCGLLALY